MLSIARLSIEDADLLIAGAEARANEIGVPMCIAVTCESGNLIAFRRMDGSKVASVVIAQNKAFTAAVARKGTHEYNALAVPGSLTFGINTAFEGRFCIVGGGLPVIVDGEIVGGIGCSSGTADQDLDCSEAGLARFLDD